MDINSALNYIFNTSEYQDEMLNIEEHPLPELNIKSNKNNNVNEKENDNMKTTTTSRKTKAQLLEENNAMQAQIAQMAEMMKQMQEQMAQLQTSVKATQTVNNLIHSNNEALKAENAKLKDCRHEEAIENYELNVNRSKWLDEVDGDKEQMLMASISDDLFSAMNPSFYANILAGYDQIELEKFYTRELIIAGSYNKELDNTDAMSKGELITAISEIYEQKFIDRMEANGKKVYASPKQLQLLKDNGYATDNIKYWWQASPIIEGIFGTNQPATTNQINKIKELVTKLELVGYDMAVKTRGDASAKIKELQALSDEKFGVEMASEGQKKYITNLCEQLFLDKAKYLTPELTKMDAIKTINELNRELLYFKYIKSGVKTITRDEIKKLSRDEVQAKLNEFRKRA